MLKVSSLFGALGGIVSIFLWFVFSFFNPYVDTLEVGFILISFTMLVLPAILAIVGAFMQYTKLMLIAFLVSFPLSLYMVGLPSLLALYGATSLSYLISWILMRVSLKRSLLMQ